MSQPPMMSGSMPYMGEQHPYDAAYGMVKKLRTDLEDLRAALHAEQQQRAAEVTELKQEVVSLREIITKERTERQSITHKLVNDLTQESSVRVKSLEELKAMHRQHLGQLNALLQDEIRDRKACESLRDTREMTAESERRSENEQVQKDICAQKAAYLSTKDEHANKINNINHDLQVVVSYLRKVSSSWDSFMSGKLLSSRKSAGVGQSSPTSGYYAGAK
mmetsp:Transcript_13259/g.20118  ORF Transcript_13259/g.20118 Transcript_13259/m.20118 type:complete len:220 (-) Transcript_13259:150-809(-)